MRHQLLLTTAAISMACGGAAYEAPVTPSGYGPAARARAQETSEPESLFPSDAEILSDSAIRRILAYDLALPQQIRVAVLQLGSQWIYRRWWSHEIAQLSTQVSAAFQARLIESPRVASVDLLPELLIPRRRTVPYLREAAARFQADLLLVYQPVCAIFERSRFLRADQYRVACTVEAVLLDTRSGIVPFSSFAAQEQVTQKADEDFELRETLARAELQVTRQAVLDLADQVGQYLTTVEVMEIP